MRWIWIVFGIVSWIYTSMTIWQILKIHPYIPIPCSYCSWNNKKKQLNSEICVCVCVCVCVSLIYLNFVYICNLHLTWQGLKSHLLFHACILSIFLFFIFFNLANEKSPIDQNVSIVLYSDISALSIGIVLIHFWNIFQNQCKLLVQQLKLLIISTN
jgi:hypothetical protein